MKDRREDYNHYLESGTDQGYSPLRLNKNDFELFDENKAVPARVVRIKRVGSANKNEKWRILENNELKFVLDGAKLTKKEKVFLRSVAGINFLINEYKMGFKSFAELKTRLKNKT